MMLYLFTVVLLSAIAIGNAQYHDYCTGGCYRNSVCYRHGDTWEEDCSTKRCRQLHSTQALVETIATRCKDAYGQCRNHGDSMIVIVNGYTETCRCTVSRNSWHYTQCSTDVIPPSQCNCNADGVCRSFGDRWVKDCFTYECHRNGDSWIGDVVGAACKDADGICRHNNEYMPYNHHGRRYENCICHVTGTTTRYDCTGSGNSNTCSGCKVNEVCHSINSRWTAEDCVIYECRKTGIWKQVQAVATECQDADRVCRAPNQYMSAIIHNTRFEHCYCEVVGMQRSYNCNYNG